jgi:hypothetical protein
MLAFIWLIEIPQLSKPFMKAICIVVLCLNYIVSNNTSFWPSLITCEIVYFLTTITKRVRPLIILLNNHPKLTKRLDALLDRHKDFSPKVHVLAGILVPVVLTNTWSFGSQEVLHKPRPHVNTARTYPVLMVLKTHFDHQHFIQNHGKSTW